MPAENKPRTTSPLADRALEGALSVRELATFLSVSRATAYTLVHSGAIPSFRLSERRIGILKTDAAEWLAARAAEGGVR